MANLLITLLVSPAAAATGSWLSGPRPGPAADAGAPDLVDKLARLESSLRAPPADATAVRGGEALPPPGVDDAVPNVLTRNEQSAAEPVAAAVSSAQPRKRMLNAPRTSRTSVDAATLVAPSQPRPQSLSASASAAPKLTSGYEEKQARLAGHLRLAVTDPQHPEPAQWVAFASQVAGAAHLKAAAFPHRGVPVRGLAAASAFEQGDVVLRVPPALMLSRAHSSHKALYEGVSFVETPDPSWSMVGLLATERRLGKASPWRPYFDHLPSLGAFKKFHPIWAEKALVRAFAALPFMEDLQAMRKRMKTQWRDWQMFAKVAARSKVPEGPSAAECESLRQAAATVTEEDMQWAFMILLTRGFSTDHGSTLAPVADDFNTDVPGQQNVRWHVEEDGSLAIRTTAPVAANQELVLGYTSRALSNDEAAKEFGFALASNPASVPSLPFAQCSVFERRLAPKQRPAEDSDGGITGPAGCQSPRRERQPAIWCLFAALAQEHCPFSKALQAS